MRLKTIIFDFGGVIINLNRSASVQRYKELGVENVDELLNNYIQSGVFLELEKGLISLDEFHNKIRQQSNTFISDQDIDDAFMAFLLDIPKYKMDKIKQLHNSYRTVILSNTNILHFPLDTGLLANSDYLISEYFDHCYLSFQMHKSKPDKDIFEALLQEEQVQSNECLFIDDSEVNINSAKELGFNCYHAVNGQWVGEIDTLIQKINQ